MKSPLTEPTDCMPQAPHVEETTAQNCIVCGSGVDHRTAMACGQDYEYETCRNHWRMWKCNHCSHVQLDPRPADSALAIIYPRNYYSYNMSENVSAFAMKCKALLDRVKFSSILSSPARQPESYLDVGCGDGRYLRLMMDRGLPFEKVQGLEIDPEAVERAAQKGLNAKCMRVEDADHIADESLDLITMFHVIEHLGSPRTVVATLVRKLKPGGVLVVETPNFESLDARIFYKRFWGG
jgi:2-polyprenyl-3-methyl-5-hydroxy-6-metoxy-1,4-benzoquinol methylase